MYVSNMTPATSVSVVDVKARKFIAEIETSGCNLVYPVGNRAFASLCGDGTVQVVSLDEQGNLKGRERSAKFFDPDKDPVTEKASRFGDTWLFILVRRLRSPGRVRRRQTEARQAVVVVHGEGTHRRMEDRRRTVQCRASESQPSVRDRASRADRTATKKPAKTCGRTISRHRRSSARSRCSPRRRIWD